MSDGAFSRAGGLLSGIAEQMEQDRRTAGFRVDNYGNSELHNALFSALRTPDPHAALKTPEIARRIDEALAGPLPTFANREGIHVEHVAAQVGDPGIIRRMAEKGADFANVKDARERTPIAYLAFARGDRERLVESQRFLEAKERESARAPSVAEDRRAAMTDALVTRAAAAAQNRAPVPRIRQSQNEM